MDILSRSTTSSLQSFRSPPLRRTHLNPTDIRPRITTSTPRAVRSSPPPRIGIPFVPVDLAEPFFAECLGIRDEWLYRGQVPPPDVSFSPPRRAFARHPAKPREIGGVRQICLSKNLANNIEGNTREGIARQSIKLIEVPSHHVVVLVLRRKHASPLVPRASVRARVLQHMEVPALRGESARELTPRAPPQTRPLQHVKVPALRRRMARIRVPGQPFSRAYFNTSSLPLRAASAHVKTIPMEDTLLFSRFAGVMATGRSALPFPASRGRAGGAVTTVSPRARFRERVSAQRDIAADAQCEKQ